MVGAIDRYVKYEKKLPFLLKILSIDQPLSLQAHPDRRLAQVLHKKDPKNYPDSNHKPELAIALTDFEVLCDFRPAEEIVNFLKSLAPLRRVVGEKNGEQYSKIVLNTGPDDQQRKALAECFKCLMVSSSDVISKEVKNLLTAEISHPTLEKNLLNLIVGLDKLYPGDPGVFAPFFLNYFRLSPGQAVYLKANKLHAYIRGECIECMSCSDNVVRAGLTTKYRDVDTLIEMLDYETVKNRSDIIFEGAKTSSDPWNIVTFAPIEDFKVDKITIPQKGPQFVDCTLPSVSSGSFIIVLAGKASINDFLDLKIVHRLSLGWAGFVPPKISPRFFNIHPPLVMYRAFC